MPLAVPRYTLADLPSFPDDGHRYELLAGTLLVTPAPGPLHDAVVMRLIEALLPCLAGHARLHQRGAVEVEPDTHLEPDLLVTPLDAVPDGIGPETRWLDFSQWWLAIEVSGRGSRVYDREHKAPAYLAIGVREAWRVDLTDRVVEIARPGEPLRLERDRLVWHPPAGDRVLDLAVQDLFRP